MQPIGVIHSPFSELAGMPIQPRGAASIEGEILLEPALSAGLKDIEGFSHLYLIYELHQAQECQLEVTPFMDNQPHGVFATRYPARPNPIGLSIVELLSVNENRLTIRGVDVLDGTPLLDIKPYIPAFDEIENARTGWMQKSRKQVADKRADYANNPES